MADVQVTCITRPNRQSMHEGITHLGGAGWKLTRADVIWRIESRSDTFYTLANRKRADVAVRQAQDGSKYVQTHADGYWNNNLLSLPECP